MYLIRKKKERNKGKIKLKSGQTTPFMGAGPFMYGADPGGYMELEHMVNYRANVRLLRSTQPPGFTIPLKLCVF